MTNKDVREQSSEVVHQLPVIRQSERVDFKRCMMKWFWRWRRGLVPKQQAYGALMLGTWMHTAMEYRYTSKRQVDLHHWFNAVSSEGLREARRDDVPEHEIAKARELVRLGLAMAKHYDLKYGDDTDIKPIGAEIPLEFDISDNDGNVVARHRLKPDLLYRDPLGRIWLLENKTAKQIALEHLPIDDQARGYASMSEVALRRAGYLKPGEHVYGVMYNFLRKAFPDERETNEKGHYLNKDGTVSKRQPTPFFVRHPVVLSSKAKLQALLHIQREAIAITNVTKELRAKTLSPNELLKTPHKSCPTLCEFFTMCVVQEQGGDHESMAREMFYRRNPYTYDQDTTEIPKSFELS